jgi:hypothetical protein
LAAGESIHIAVTFNGEELATYANNEYNSLELLVGEVPEVVRIEPQVVIWGEYDIEITVFCIGLIDTRSLSCYIGKLILDGTYGETEEGD